MQTIIPALAFFGNITKYYLTGCLKKPPCSVVIINCYYCGLLQGVRQVPVGSAQKVMVMQ